MINQIDYISVGQSRQNSNSVVTKSSNCSDSNIICVTRGSATRTFLRNGFFSDIIGSPVWGVIIYPAFGELFWASVPLPFSMDPVGCMYVLCIDYTTCIFWGGVGYVCKTTTTR